MKIKNRKQSCLNCGKMFSFKYEQTRKYCSNRCSGLARNDESNKENIICATCGKRFKDYKVLNRKYCSRECVVRARTIYKGTEKECVVCGKPFEPRKRESRCCSRDCQIILTNKTLKENGTRTERTLRKECIICGAVYYVSPFHGYSTYCSKACADRAWNYKKRAAKALVESEYYSVQEIYERDKWRCQICGKKVNPKLKWPDTKSASIDHITPLSKGGANTKDNVQLAHLGCNSAKRSRNIMPNEKGQYMIV